jgi:acyl-CoA synthetase (AMP-forming)/AMP-acid ligase II
LSSLLAFHVLGDSYGAVDGSIAARTSIYNSKEKMINTVGKPIRGSVVRIIDDNANEVLHDEKGEITGMSVHGGNLINAEACSIIASEGLDENGFFHSGDIGSFDEDGYLKIIDRKKDMILRGGQNIFPGEIEELLMRHPNVARIAIVGMPDRELGERAKEDRMNIVRGPIIIKEGRYCFK